MENEKPKFTPKEMFEIINTWIPEENGFRDPYNGEFVTDEQMLEIQGDFKDYIDYLGIKKLEIEKRSASKKELGKHYIEESKLDEKREERLAFYLGYLTQGKKTTCEHVTICFYGKQERLALRCKDNQVPMNYKRPSVSYVPDTAKIREALELINNHKEGIIISQDILDVLEFAYIDTRKKATVK